MFMLIIQQKYKEWREKEMFSAFYRLLMKV